MSCSIPNQATQIMLSWTILFESGCVHDRNVKFNKDDLKEHWIDEMINNSEEYDEQWFPLIATKSIMNTIDWDYIAKELPKHLNYDN